MIRLTVIDSQGNTVTIDKLQTAAELSEVRDRARDLIRDCDRLINQKHPKKVGTGVPYA